MNDGHVGRVVALEADTAVVRFQRSSMCAHCGACLTFGDKEMECRVKNELNASVGDRVRVELSGRKIVGASLIAYCIPLAALLFGVLVGSRFSDLMSIILGLVCCGTGYLLLRVLDRRFQRVQSFRPHMITILTDEEEDE